MMQLTENTTTRKHSPGYYVGLGAMGFFYIVAGINHFVHPVSYIAVLPPYIPQAASMVLISGIAEVLGGIGLLVPRTRSFSAWGLALMLVAFLPVHINMCLHPGVFPTVPLWAIWLRLPLQLPLILWALYYTRK
jgi:uncharacterized membrane protein